MRMGPFDVGQGPVVFDRSYESVPRPPAPNLGGLGSGFGEPGNLLLTLGVVAMVSSCGYAVLKGKKDERVKNFKLLAGAGVFGAMILSSSLGKPVKLFD